MSGWRPAQLLLIIYVSFAHGFDSFDHDPKILLEQELSALILPVLYPPRDLPTVTHWTKRDALEPSGNVQRKICFTDPHLQTLYSGESSLVGHFEEPDVDPNDVYGPAHALSVDIYHTLSLEGCSIVIFHEKDGPGLVSMQAKRAGLALANTLLVLVLNESGPVAPLGTFQTLLSDYMTRRGVEIADLVLCSPYGAAARAASGWNFLAPVVSVNHYDFSALITSLRVPDKKLQRDAAALPRVSVIIPTHNRAQFLTRCVASALNQTYQGEIEVIIVDDASTDEDVGATLAMLEQRDSGRVRAFRRSHAGPGAARNFGASVATSDLLIFLDDDNIARYPMIDVMVQAIYNSGADVVAAASSGFEDGDEESFVDTWIPVGPAIAAQIFFHCIGETLMIIKKSTFLESGGFPTDLNTNEDMEFHTRLALSGANYAVIPDSIMKYRQHDQQRHQVVDADTASMFQWKQYSAVFKAGRLKRIRELVEVKQAEEEEEEDEEEEEEEEEELEEEQDIL